MLGMEPADGSEEATWRRGIAGDPEGFGILFDRHRDRIFRHAYAYLGDVSDAEDAAAIAFLELWRLRRRVRLVEGSILPWLLVTTTNVCRNVGRARQGYRRLLDALPHAEPVPSAEDTALRDASTPALAAALQRLGKDDAKLLALVALESYSVTDAAVALGISGGAARVRLHRARARLRELLGHDTLDGYLSEEAR
jgi:RNA polymerase sigma factor (sigma-70 family)